MSESLILYCKRVVVGDAPVLLGHGHRHSQRRKPSTVSLAPQRG